jgi:hypothetical protein
VFLVRVEYLYLYCISKKIYIGCETVVSCTQFPFFWLTDREEYGVPDQCPFPVPEIVILEFALLFFLSSLINDFCMFD